jgi:hypothetical protein
MTGAHRELLAIEVRSQHASQSFIRAEAIRPAPAATKKCRWRVASRAMMP